MLALIGDGALTGGLAYEGLQQRRGQRRAADRHSQRQRHVHRPRTWAACPGTCARLRLQAASIYDFKRRYRQTLTGSQPGKRAVRA